MVLVRVSWKNGRVEERFISLQVEREMIHKEKL
jgi:hypothetical protein